MARLFRILQRGFKQTPRYHLFPSNEKYEGKPYEGKCYIRSREIPVTYKFKQKACHNANEKSLDSSDSVVWELWDAVNGKKIDPANPFNTGIES